MRDQAASQLGGQHIWGLPKRLATFDWQDKRVQVTDDRGWTVTATTQPTTRVAMPLVVPMAAFGIVDTRLTFALAAMRATISPASFQILDWPESFPELTTRTGALSFTARRFRITAPAPHPIGRPR
ncbi:hypothetical protein ABZX92_30815 [Lentzea sp. NPDC006480]|uniref:hypothetical protein n=1 Tax=Lentzea sp. NPDC006480 TaxID=3157176 RepID=UPI0033A61751